MCRETKIVCPYCNKDTAYTEEGLRHLVLTADLKCPHCQRVIIIANYVECSSMAWGCSEE